MADIRQNQSVLDDFNRANESPLSGGGNWGLLDSGVPWSQCDLVSQRLTLGVGTASSMSVWLPSTYDGDDAEAWGHAWGGGVISGAAWAVGLFLQPGGSNQADGYRYRMETVGDPFKLYKVTNGVSTQIDSASSGPGQADYWHLIRRNGNDVECWTGSASNSTANWTMTCSAPDTSYTTGLYAALGCTENSTDPLLGWDDFGAGAANWIPEFIRRPWRYQGRALDLP